MHTLLLSTAASLVLLSPAMADAQKHYYGAVASVTWTDNNCPGGVIGTCAHGSSGVSLNSPTQIAADRAAISNCLVNSGSHKCVIRYRFGNGKCGYASPSEGLVGENLYIERVGFGPNASAAMDQCQWSDGHNWNGLACSGTYGGCNNP